MAFGDIKGKSAGTRLSQQFDRAKLEAELESEQASNIEVGDFLSELATAVRFRMKNGQSQGDWIDEPERMFTDGLIFATQQAVASEVKLQITLSLDTSTSMWMNRLMKHAGPAMLAFDRVIRKAIADLPQGSIAYQPFIFHGTARKVPAAFLNSYVGSARKASGEESDSTVWPQIPTQDQLDAAIKAGDLPEGTRRTNFDMSGPDTLIAPLFRAIQEWEKVEGDPNAVRLDIVITDGVFGDTETSVEADDPDSDIDAATVVQEERNGRLRTVLLNFLKLDEWSNRQLPDRCAQFAVDADNLNTAIRDILQEAVADLFA